MNRLRLSSPRPPAALRGCAFRRRAHFHRRAASSATTAQVVGRLRCPLLEQQPILLQVALDVLSRRRVIALDAHQLRDRLRLRPVDPQLGARLLEARVQLRRPDDAASVASCSSPAIRQTPPLALRGCCAAAYASDACGCARSVAKPSEPRSEPA